MTMPSMSNTLRSCACALVLAVLGCNSEPIVEVRTSVGSASQNAEPKMAALAALVQAWWQNLSFRAPAQATTEQQTEPQPPQDETALRQALHALREGPFEDVAGWATRLTHTPRSLWPAIERELMAPTISATADYKAVLDVIGGDVPNRYGHFARTWKRAHGYNVLLSEDWLADLLALPASRIGPLLRPVLRDCIARVSLLRAAAQPGEPDEGARNQRVGALLRLGYLNDGLFRDEIARVVTSLGEAGVAPLVTHVRVAEGIEQDMASFAGFLLDRMGRRVPARAIAERRNQPHETAALLRAYGTSLPPDAAEVVLGFVNNPHRDVRNAAREAFTAYLSTAHIARAKTIRLLGGRNVTAQAFVSPRARAVSALEHRLKEVAPTLLTCAANPCAPEMAARAYFAYLDLARTTSHARNVKAALATGDENILALAVHRAGQDTPALFGASDVAAALFNQAKAHAKRHERSDAARLLRKASSLLATDHRAWAPLRQAAAIFESQAEGLDAAERRAMLRTAGITTDRTTRLWWPLLQMVGLVLCVGGAWGLWWARARMKRNLTMPGGLEHAEVGAHGWG